MIRNVLIGIIYVLLLVACESGTTQVRERIAAAQKSHDGRYRSDCNFHSGSRAVCRISFEQLAANPENYNERVVSFAGYAAIDSGDLLIYPDKFRYTYRVNESSVGLKVPYDEEARLAERYKRKYVRVVGVFSAKVFEPDQPRVGILEGDVEMSFLEPRPTLKEDDEVSIKIDLNSESSSDGTK